MKSDSEGVFNSEADDWRTAGQRKRIDLRTHNNGPSFIAS